MPETSGLGELGQRTLDVGAEISAALLELVNSFLSWLPRIIGALIIILIGIYIAKLVRGLVNKLLEVIKLEVISEKFKVTELIQTSGVDVTISRIILWLVYWIILLVFLSSASNVLGVAGITRFIGVLISYIPAIFAGLIIMLIGVIAANVVGDIIDHVAHGKAYKKIVRWLILLIAFVTAIEQLGFDLSFITDNVTIVIAGIMLAIGIAFGLGGKDSAKAFIEKHIK